MKVLQVNKFFYEYGRAGGAGKYLFNLIRLLEQHRHKTIHFGMMDKYTKPSPWTRFFVSEMDIEKVSLGFKGLKTAFKIIYSIEAKRKIEALIKKTKPDIVHLHNIYHQISPSILSVFKKYKIPVIQTVHDYKLICPNYHLFTQGKICERCNTYKFYQAVIHRCVKNSLPASILACLEMYLHRCSHIYERNVNYFICPSRFVKDELMKFKVNPKQTVHLSHFVDIDKFQPNFSFDNYFLYLGRLSYEKGLDILIRAMARIPKNFQLYIAGTGPQEKELKQYVADHKLANLKFLGHISGDRLKSILSKTMFVVVPSRIFETFGLTILEAYASGKPVVGTNLGPIPELIEEGKTGLIFQSGNADDLADKINFMLEHQDKIIEMGKKGRILVEEKYTPEKHYQGLMEIYKKVTP